MKPEGVIPHCFGDSEERNSMIELPRRRNTVSFNNEADRHFFVPSLSREIRECLKLDPDHKDCFPFYKV